MLSCLWDDACKLTHAGFLSRYLSGLPPYNRKYNVLRASLNKTFPSFLSVQEPCQNRVIPSGTCNHTTAVATNSYCIQQQTHFQTDTYSEGACGLFSLDFQTDTYSEGASGLFSLDFQTDTYSGRACGLFSLYF